MIPSTSVEGMPLVLDISSDEEEGLNEGSKNTDLEWLKDLLFNSDDDSDDVVITHENKPQDLKSKSSTLSVNDDDDDDCVILEGDPENGVTSVVEDSTGSDELVVVGEKGQVACRDYPHARHLCATFPFSSTPHEKHCVQCHCYVCDSLAPCLMWGTGISTSDHCHANDKIDVWKIQRKNFKRVQSSPLPASTNYGISLGAIRSHHNRSMPRDIVHLSPVSVLQNQAIISTALHTPSINSIPQNQVSRPKATYAHFSPSSGMLNQISRPTNISVSKATNPTIPNGANHGRYLESRSNLARDRNHPKKFLGVRNHVIQREHGRVPISITPQFIRSPRMSKGVVGSTVNTMTVNLPSHGSSGINNRVNAVCLQLPDNLRSTGFSNPLNLSIFSQSNSRPVSLSGVKPHTPHTGTPEPQYGQALSQSNNSQNFYQTCIQGNNNVPYAVCPNSNQNGNEFQINSQDENANGNITQSGVTSQDTCQPKPQEESPHITARIFSAFGSNLAENLSQSTEPVIECPPLQSSGSTDQPPNVEKSVTEAVATIEPVNESSCIPSSIVEFENWLSGNETGPMASDDVFSFEMNIPSPDPSPFDMDSNMLWW